MIKLRLILEKICEKFSTFSSAATFFPRTGWKILPRFRNTDTFADRKLQHPRFCNGVDLMSYLRGVNNLFIYALSSILINSHCRHPPYPQLSSAHITDRLRFFKPPCFSGKLIFHENISKSGQNLMSSKYFTKIVPFFNMLLIPWAFFLLNSMRKSQLSKSIFAKKFARLDALYVCRCNLARRIRPWPGVLSVCTVCITEHSLIGFSSRSSPLLMREF